MTIATSAIDRRGVLSMLAGSAALAAAAPASAQVTDRDADLVRLDLELDKALKMVRVSKRRYKTAETRYHALRSPEPEQAPEPEESRRMRLASTLEEIADRDHPVNVRARERKAVYRDQLAAWESDGKKLMAATGLNKASVEHCERFDQAVKIAEAILATRAQSLRGIGIKAALPNKLQVDSNEVVRSIAADVALLA